MIIEIGEELENPVENMTVSGQLGGEPVEGGLAAVGSGILPEPVLLVVGIAALIAAATTVNTLFTSYSRTAMRAARHEVLPDVFADVHDDYNTPHRAVLLFGVPPLLAAPFRGQLDALTGPDVLDWLVVIVVTGIFIAFTIGGIAMWNLPKVFPQRYEYSFYKLPMPLLRVVAVGNVVVSILFTLLVIQSAPSAFLVVLAWMVLSTGLYFYRIRAYDRKGVDLKARMALLHKHEQVGGGDED
jgi:APA family basic amino acid/polyamine antiporter